MTVRPTCGHDGITLVGLCPDCHATAPKTEVPAKTARATWAGLAQRFADRPPTATGVQPAVNQLIGDTTTAVTALETLAFHTPRVGQEPVTRHDAHQARDAITALKASCDAALAWLEGVCQP